MLLSFIDKTSMKFVLVSNGCDDKEWDILKGLAEIFNTRLEARRISKLEVLNHPEVLNLLFEEHHEPYFAFMDSDILTCDDISDRLNAEMVDSTAIFSAAPIWSESPIVPDGHLQASGRYLLDRDGYCLGGTYFAIYRTSHVSKVMETWKIGFENQRFDALSEEIKLVLERANRIFKRYDNAKVINILLQDEGLICKYMEFDGMYHFGGLSRFMTFISKSEKRMERHIEKRKGQKKMRQIGMVMATCLDEINLTGSYSTSHFKATTELGLKIKNSLDRCKALRIKYAEKIDQLGL